MSTTYFELFTRRDEDAVPFAAGATIFEAGDSSDGFFVVREGAAPTSARRVTPASLLSRNACE
jgi:CRP-like cAMP-binding protein